MAVALSATLRCVAFAIHPTACLERGDGLTAQIGVHVGLVGAAVWALGSGLPAEEVEGADRHDATLLDR